VRDHPQYLFGITSHADSSRHLGLSLHVHSLQVSVEVQSKVVPKHFFSYLDLVEHRGGQGHVARLSQAAQHRGLGLILNIVSKHQVHIAYIGTSLKSDSLSMPERWVISDSPDPLSRSGAWKIGKLRLETKRKEYTYLVVAPGVRAVDDRNLKIWKIKSQDPQGKN
jgi:hypothetical protein